MSDIMEDDNDYLSPTSIINVISRYNNGTMNNDKFIKLVESGIKKGLYHGSDL